MVRESNHQQINDMSCAVFDVCIDHTLVDDSAVALLRNK